MCTAILLAMSRSAIAHAMQTAPEAPSLQGRIVQESDGAPIAGARIDPHPSFKTPATDANERGEFALTAKPKNFSSNATNHEPYDSVEYLTITATGHARTIVDPCADAPWAAPIRVRTSSTLRGRVDGLPPGPGHHVAVLVSWKDLCWPPRTGLTRVDERWIGDLDADGRFEIRDVPAEVPPAIRFDAGTSHGLGAWLTKDLALAPGEARELALDASGSKTPADDENIGSGRSVDSGRAR